MICTASAPYVLKIRTARAVPTPLLCRKTIISRMIFCSAQAAVMRLARTAPMPVTSRRRSGSASIVSNTFSPKARTSFFGVDWSNAAYHARAEVFLDAVERRRLRGLQKLRLKLLAVGAIVDPLARRCNPLSGGDDRSMPDHRDQFPVPTGFDPQNTKAGFIVVERHALDRAC